MNFYETKMGQCFFNAQLPKLIRSLEQIASALTRPAAPTCAVPFEHDPNFLRDLYYGEYDPSECKKNERLPNLNTAVSDAEHALRKELGTDTSASAAFDAYQLAQGERDSAVVEQAFESGYQTAMQMIIAGLRSPVSSAPFISEEQRQGERHDQN